MAVQQLGDGNPDGSCLEPSGGKLGFFGTTPVVKQTVGAAVASTAATNSSPYGFAQAQADAIVARLNEIRAALVAHGLI